MNEFEMMKHNPQGLFDYYLQIMQAGTPLNDGQVVKMEYLKKILLKEV
jgi:hypothetical protein